MIDPMNRLGEFIRAARKSKDISQQKLADMILYDRNNILNMEAGRKLFPNERLEQIATVLEIPYERLLALKVLDKVNDRVLYWLKMELCGTEN